MEVFDAHCHFDDEQFDPDREEAYKRMLEKQVTRCVCAGSDLASSARCIAFAAQHEGAYAALGVHPHEAQKAPEDYLSTLESMLKMDKVVALGEIGLDYYYDYSPRDVQKQRMNEQIDLALQLNMPVVFHIRDAHGDVLDALHERKTLPSGVIHCFSGSREVAQEYVRLGFYVSFSGSLTFKKAHHLWEAAQAVPLERLLVETDSPYLSPEPLRGRRNEPANVCLVLEQLAKLREASVEQMAKITFNNACAVYRLTPDIKMEKETKNG